MKPILLCLTIISVLGCSDRKADPLGKVTLGDGTEYEIVSISKKVSTEHAPTLVLRYASRIGGLDSPELRVEARAIWPVFRREVEKLGYSRAIVAAVSKKNLLITEVNNSVEYVFERKGSTSWVEPF